MTWFKIIKAGIYYHVTSPELAKEIVEKQVISAGKAFTMPWMKELMAQRKQQPISDYTTVTRMPKEGRKLRDAEGRLRERSPQWADRYYRDNPEELQQWKEKLQDKQPKYRDEEQGLSNTPPAEKIVLFWEDFEDLKAFYHDVKSNAQMEEIDDDTKIAVVKCDIDVDLIPYPRIVGAHTPTARDDTPRQTARHIYPPTFNEHGIAETTKDTRTGKARTVYDYKWRFNFEHLKSAHYYPRAKGDITGTFEEVMI